MRARQKHTEYLGGIAGPVGDKLRRFDAAGSLHDSLPDRCIVRPTGEIEMRYVCRDGQRRSSLLRVSYRKARFLTPAIDAVRAAFEDINVEILDAEFDVSADEPGRFIHRLMMWPEQHGEVVISFTDLDWTAKDLDQHERVNVGAPFTVEPGG